jgi:hypothetical protein
MQKKLKVGLPETDHRALLKCVAVYKKMSRRNSAELSTMEPHRLERSPKAASAARHRTMRRKADAAA